MAATVNSAEARLTQHLDVLLPYLKKMLRDAPEFGGVGIEASFSDGEITRVEVRANVSRKLAPRSERGLR
jgi:hypothetical protein